MDRGIVCLGCGANFGKDQLRLGTVCYETSLGTVIQTESVCPRCGSNQVDFALNE